VHTHIQSLLSLAICPVLLLTASKASASCDGTVATAGSTVVDVGGVSRAFVIRLPAAYDGRAEAPVVFAFHPFGMNAGYMQSRVPIARAWPEAIVIYPEGSTGAANRQPGWQTTATPGSDSARGNADIQFFDAMLAWLESHACIDRQRVFVMGYSNGAQFANLLACERGDSIAGAAVAAGRLPCRPSAAKPVVISHGLQDRTIGYDQAVIASRVWAERNGCAAPPKAGILGCVTGQECSVSPTTLCTHAGGHEYDLQFTRTVVDSFRQVRTKN
jgi:polyhydroxybutyrate depolymerase